MFNRKDYAVYGIWVVVAFLIQAIGFKLDKQYSRKDFAIYQFKKLILAFLLMAIIVSITDNTTVRLLLTLTAGLYSYDIVKILEENKKDIMDAFKEFLKRFTFSKKS